MIKLRVIVLLNHLSSYEIGYSAPEGKVLSKKHSIKAAYYLFLGGRLNETGIFIITTKQTR